MIVAWKVCLRPNRSESLPMIGVAMHWVSRYPTETHGAWLWLPSSPTMVGIAVLTMVPSIAARNIPVMTAVITRWICLGVSPLPACRSSVCITLSVDDGCATQPRR